MVSIRYQLEDLRLICDLVKRREKSKQKLNCSQGESFKKKIEIIDSSWKFDSKVIKDVQRNSLSVDPVRGKSTLKESPVKNKLTSKAESATKRSVNFVQ